jgi:2-polyprenyl-3-methyl-5-hydroxy-6-metoxy-1,4-benzoquinol methylase
MIQSSNNEAALHAGRVSGYEEAEAYRRSFIDSSTGRIREELVEKRDCPVCASGHKETLFEKDGGTYHRCHSCHLIYLDPVLTDSCLAEYYRGNNEVQAESHEREDDFYRAIYNHGLDLVSRWCPGGKLLDVGCSSGAFLELATSAGFDAEGLELNASEAAIARSRGFCVHEAELRELPAEAKFDVICLWDVFEHIKDGKSFLAQARRFLQGSQIVFMQIPSADSLSARVMRERCNMFDGIEHVNLYSHENIQTCLDASGYEIVDTVDVIDDSGALTNYLNYEDPYEGSFSRSGLEVFDPDFILTEGFGYKMQIVARLKEHG